MLCHWGGVGDAGFAEGHGARVGFETGNSYGQGWLLLGVWFLLAVIRGVGAGSWYKVGVKIDVGDEGGVGLSLKSALVFETVVELLVLILMVLGMRMGWGCH